MTEGGASDTVKQAKADYGWALMVLGALLSASSVISLIQHGFHFQLNWGFDHFVAFYRGMITPVMDVVLWPVQALLGWLHVDWIIPQWLKHLWVLSFVGAGIAGRSLHRALLEEVQAEPEFRRLARQGLSFVVMRAFWVFWVWLFAIGLLGVGLFVVFFAFGKDEVLGDGKDGIGDGIGFHHFLRTNLIMTVVAVIAFYVSNAIAPQLGLG
jgi:hypothetical protein